MIERLNKPIAYDARRWGYYYTEPLDKVRSVTLSQADMLAMVAWHNLMPAYQGTPLEKPMAAAFEKLTGQLDSKELYTLQNLGDALSFRTVGPEVTDLKTFEVLTGALEKRRVVSFAYRRYGQREVRRRRVHPYHLASIDSHWYLFAHDAERKRVQTYALSRMSEARMEAERFVRPRHFDRDEYLGKALGVMKGQEDYEIVIEFDSYGTDLVRSRKWHASQEFTELEDGRSRLRMRLSGLEEIERTVLSWGRHATVVAPGELLRRVAETAKEITAKYAGSGSE
jgi:predicted DNA-binding transcriptional regulator YafY